jgi:hypothetical protein
MSGMLEFSLTKQIQAPPERVFDVFVDLDRAADRISGIVRMEKLTPGPVGVGTRFCETRVMFRRETTEELEFIAFDRGKSYTVGCTSCGTEWRTTFRFRPDGETTIVEMGTQIRPVSFLARLMAPLGKMMAGSMKKCLDRDMTDLKEVIESSE